VFVDTETNVVRRHEVLPVDGIGSPIATFELSDYRLLGENLWLPYRLSRAARSPAIRVETIVEHYRVNDVADSVFQFDPPPGTIVYDRDTDQYHQIPGGMELLDQVAALVSHRVTARGGATNPWRGAFLVGAGSFVIAYIGLWLSARRPAWLSRTACSRGKQVDVAC